MRQAKAAAAVGWRMHGRRGEGGGRRGGGRPRRERAWFFCNLHIGIRADDFATCVVTYVYVCGDARVFSTGGGCTRYGIPCP